MPTVWAALRNCCAKLPFFNPPRHRCALPPLPKGEALYIRGKTFPSMLKGSPFGGLAVNEVNRLRGFKRRMPNEN